MSRPIQPYYFQANIIWCDGTFTTYVHPILPCLEIDILHPTVHLPYFYPGHPCKSKFYAFFQRGEKNFLWLCISARGIVVNPAWQQYAPALLRKKPANEF